MAEPIKAIGNVTIRHTCDGALLRPDYVEKRMVYYNQRARIYYVRLFARDWPITRQGNTRNFLCLFAGRTTADA